MFWKMMSNYELLEEIRHIKNRNQSSEVTNYNVIITYNSFLSCTNGYFECNLTLLLQC